MGRVVERIFIPIRLPALNELREDAKCVRLNRRGRFYRYHTVKEKYEDQIIAYLLTNPPAKRGLSGVKLKFIWHEPDRKRDPDNISSGGRKILLDALTKAGILEPVSLKEMDGSMWLDLRMCLWWIKR